MKVLLAVLATACIAAAASPFAGAQPSSPRPVPSLTPKVTQKLWTKLVHRPQVRRASADSCRSLRAVFYTSTDWLRLATKLAANPSPCAQYYISIPPLAGDKTTFRYDQPWRIRALGPQFHVLAEINYTGWSNWATANNATFYQAGVEARRRMAAQGFDIAAGDAWVVNELSSAVRANTGLARQRARDLVHGLYDGDGSGPKVKGAVFIAGIGQQTADLSTYKVNLQSWYLDTPFWQDMSAYVSDWSQEVYGDARAYGVAGAALADRTAHLNDYLQHEVALADAAPSDAAAARSFVAATSSPLANAAWSYGSGFGFTDIPLAQMEDYVSAQVDALRSFGAARGLPQDHFGFAWAPQMPGNVPWTSDFTAQTGQLLDRLAAAIHDSAISPDAACTGWCTLTVDGASFVETWKTFATWSYPALAFASAPQTLTAGSASAPISVQLQQAGIVQAAAGPLTVTLSSSSASGSFSTAATGPWTSTLSLSIPAGTSSAAAYYRDTAAGTPTLTATASGRQSGTQTETVSAAALATLSVAPATATVPLNTTKVFTVTGADTFGNPVAAAVAWSTSSGTVTPTSGSSAVFTPSAAGSLTVTASAGTVAASATVTVTAATAHVSSIAYTRTSGILYATITTNVPNATLGVRILKNSVSYAAGTVTTGSNGTAVARVSAPSGCYAASITSFSAAGYGWDGVTPANGRCF